MGSKNKWNQVFRWLPGVIISALAIFAVLKFSNIEDIKTAFTEVSPGFILLIASLDILGLVVRGKAWQVILGSDVSYSQAFFGIGEGYFLNNVLPFRAGELGRSYFVGRNTGKGTFFVLSTIVIERAFDIVFAAALVIVTLPYLIGMDWVKPVALLALIFVLLALILLYLIARNRQSLLDWIEKFKKPNRFWAFLHPKVKNIIDGFVLLAKPSQFFQSLFWITICWLIWTLVYFAAVVAILPGSPFWWGAFVSGILALGVAIPSAPSALGVYEATFVGALAILGAPSGTALAYAILLHLTQFVVSAVFGIWGLVREGLSFTQLFSSIGSMASEKGKESE